MLQNIQFFAPKLDGRTTNNDRKTFVANLYLPNSILNCAKNSIKVQFVLESPDAKCLVIDD